MKLVEFLICLVSTTVVVLSLGSIWGQAEGNYNTAGLPRHQHSAFLWSYTGMHEWGGVCTSGRRQSPISLVNLIEENADDVNSSVVTSSSLSSLVFSSKCHLDAENTQVVIQNQNYTIHVRFVYKRKGEMVKWDTCMTKDPLTHTPYRFQEMDFHIGPEHFIPHVHADAELHLKFLRIDEDESSEDSSQLKYLYLALPLKVVKDSSGVLPDDPPVILDSLLTDGVLPLSDTMTSSPLARNLSLFDFLPKTNDGYLTYLGSLTQPPCTENVRWVVFSTPMPLFPLAFKQLKETISMETSSNARSPQPVNNRTVLRFLGGRVDWEEDKGFTKKTFAKEKELNDGNDKLSGKGHHTWAEKMSNMKSLFQKREYLWRVLLCCGAILIGFTLGVTGYRRWKNPAVVGVDPRVLRPLISQEERLAMYGSV